MKYGKFGHSIWKMFTTTLTYMSIAALIDGKVLYARGGLSPYPENFEQIEELRCPCVAPPPYGLFCDLLWSHPESRFKGYANSPRGISFTFCENVVHGSRGSCTLLLPVSDLNAHSDDVKANTDQQEKTDLLDAKRPISSDLLFNNGDVICAEHEDEKPSDMPLMFLANARVMDFTSPRSRHFGRDRDNRPRSSLSSVKRAKPLHRSPELKDVVLLLGLLASHGKREEDGTGMEGGFEKNWRCQ
ncbi:hypothetical protein QR680_002766 [Steinernema hermaphroditum]|uniref:Calcineurin-like phosphoesterase domain-containing protein n=1 Tax=Steinernema hermaphroditum TaxID=289476 RepID=A0AA39H3Z5_9BILA|nr:hypothetical protein QR680_002766 [Steinernema hermaphroditum]